MKFAFFAIALTLAGQQPQQPAQDIPTFTTTTNLVILTVSVKDRAGRPMEGLTKDHFTIEEDGKKQTIAVFELERLGLVTKPPAAPRANPPAAATASLPAQPPETTRLAVQRFQDRRLLVFYFDFDDMAPPDQHRALSGALKFLDEQMTEKDMVAMFAYSSELRLIQDFTCDRQVLTAWIRRMRDKGGSDLTTGPEADADDAEFEQFNTDRRLAALQDVTRELARFPEKKALVYFSGGGRGIGIENLAQLRKTVNDAVKANISYYPVDVRGLAAVAPAGGAGSAQRGTALFSGGAAAQGRGAALAQQDTMQMLAADTGGKRSADSNDLTLGIRQAQEDIASYYILGYYSSNPATDGKFRNVRIETRGAGNPRLEYRPGYYAAKVFKDFDAREKEDQLMEALRLENPVTDMPVALEINYFRVSSGKYFVPVSVKMPSAAVSRAARGSRQETEFDFVGRVFDKDGRPVAALRDTIKVRLRETGGAASRPSFQYDSGFVLPHGDYTFKFLVRENLEGSMGTFETNFTIPNADGERKALRLSSVVWSGQVEKMSEAVGSAAVKKSAPVNPLVQQGIMIVPSVTRVFDPRQTLRVYFEVYGIEETPDVAATVSLFSGNERVLQSQPVRCNQPVAGRPDTYAVQVQLPLTGLEPGSYVAQVNVIDEAGRKFAFPRTQLILRNRQSLEPQIPQKVEKTH